MPLSILFFILFSRLNIHIETSLLRSKSSYVTVAFWMDFTVQCLMFSFLNPKTWKESWHRSYSMFCIICKLLSRYFFCVKTTNVMNTCLQINLLFEYINKDIFYWNQICTLLDVYKACCAKRRVWAFSKTGSFCILSKIA